MINSNMREYDYYLLGKDNGYGQSTLIVDDNMQPLKQGVVKLSISRITQAVAEDIRYSDSTYVGITMDNTIDDTYVIQFGNELLKVKYVNPDGRFTQVFMGSYGCWNKIRRLRCCF